MDERKHFLVDLAETVVRHLPQHAERNDESTPRRSWMRWLGRQLVPNIGTLLLVAVLILTQQVWAEPLLGTTNVPGPSANTVNYQGRLADDAGTPLDGSYGMSFALYDAPTDGNLVWGPEAHDAVPVTDGLFSVGLGSQTSGGIPTTTWNGDRYLEVTVGGETLSPRELIRSVPIAGMALTVPDGAIGSRQMSPTFFQENVGADFNVPEGTGSDDNLVALELTVDFPVDATYLILINFVSRGSADGRILGSIQDENGSWITQAVHNSHPVGGMNGTQTGSSTAVHQFSAGTHTLRLVVWETGTGGYVRGGTTVTAIPFAQTP